MPIELSQASEAAKLKLGTRWILHHANRVERKTPFTKTAGELRAGLCSKGH